MYKRQQQQRSNLEQVAADADVSNFEDRSGLVLVNSNEDVYKRQYDSRTDSGRQADYTEEAGRKEPFMASGLDLMPMLFERSR